MIKEERLQELERLRKLMPSFRNWAMTELHSCKLILDRHGVLVAESAYASVVNYFIQLHASFDDLLHTIRRQRTEIEELRARLHALDNPHVGCSDSSCEICWGQEEAWWNVS